MKDKKLIDLARAVSITAHQAIGQRRKYTREPYWHHPFRVAERVKQVTSDADMIAAAWLHDVLEDTKVSAEDLWKIFPLNVLRLVQELTNERPLNLNRAQRKMLDRTRLMSVSWDAQTIKLADILDNAPSVIKYDPNFAKVWLREQQELVPLLNKGDATLWQAARSAVGLV